MDREGNVRRVYGSGKTKSMKPYYKKMSGSQRTVVKITRDGKPKEEILMRLVALTFWGHLRKGVWQRGRRIREYQRSRRGSEVCMKV